MLFSFSSYVFLVVYNDGALGTLIISIDGADGLEKEIL